MGKLPYRRAQRCKFLAYSYTTILVPTYIVLIVNDNGTYGSTRISKDIIFDESVVFYKYIDNPPTDEEFAALPVIIENMHKEPHEKVKIIWFGLVIRTDMSRCTRRIQNQNQQEDTRHYHHKRSTMHKTTKTHT